MSANILILNGSPREHGNTAYLVGKVAEGLHTVNPDASVDIVRLDELNITPCRGCDACRNEERNGPNCAMDDDMQGLYQKVVKADAIVLACPIYWFSVNAQMKLFLDRLYGLWIERSKVFKGKPIAAVFVYGDADQYSSGAVNAIGMMKSFWDYTGAVPAGVVHGSANNIGDAEKNADLARKAMELGKSLL